MIDSRHKKISVAVVDLLNNAPQGTFSQDFDAKRGYLVKTELRELKDLRLVVAARPVMIEADTRSEFAHDYLADIGIQRQVNPTDLNAVDALVAFADEVIDYVKGEDFDAINANWHQKVEVMGPITKHLEDQQLFTMVVSPQYRMIEP